MPLKDYIQGNKRGKDANRLEREAMNDPFLQEALEGFDKVAGDHAKIVRQLEKKYSRRRTFVPQRRTLAPLPHKRMLVFWSVAASVLFFLIGFSVYLLLEKKESKIPAFAENRPAENESIIPIDSSMSRLAQAEAPQMKKTVPAEADKKVISAPAESIRLSDSETD